MKDEKNTLINPTAQTTSRYKSPLLILILGTICVSFSPIFVKWMGIAQMNPTAIGFWRMFIGGLALIVMNLFFKKSFRISRQMMFYTMLAGFAFAVDLFVWHRAIMYVGAGMATILGNTQVFFTSILAFFFFKEKLSWRYIVSVLAAFCGLMLLINIFDQSALSNTKYMLGVGLGLATGVAYASFLTVLKTASTKYPNVSSMTVIIWISFFSAFFMGVMTLIERQPLLPPDLESLLVLSLLGIVAQAVGWFLITYAVSKIRVSITALVLLLQPFLATIWGFMFFAEHLVLVQIVGASIMLGAIYFGSVKNKTVT